MLRCGRRTGLPTLLRPAARWPSVCGQAHSPSAGFLLRPCEAGPCGGALVAALLGAGLARRQVDVMRQAAGCAGEWDGHDDLRRDAAPVLARPAARRRTCGFLLPLRQVGAKWAVRRDATAQVLNVSHR